MAKRAADKSLRQATFERLGIVENEDPLDFVNNIDDHLLSLEDSVFREVLGIDDVAGEIEIDDELEEIFSDPGDLAVSEPWTRYGGESVDITCYTLDGAWSSGS